MFKLIKWCIIVCVALIVIYSNEIRAVFYYGQNMYVNAKQHISYIFDNEQEDADIFLIEE